jgi:hypothetical protein
MNSFLQAGAPRKQVRGSLSTMPQAVGEKAQPLGWQQG